ncbi:MAG: V-type ATP synthase subunit A [Firmicutes bacterium]|jgi:V/A-type H+-transporting ATPase subunit A|nr:V-type ATP synthase subunit A [Bacillota bacterium]
MNMSGRIVKVSGPLVVAEGLPEARMYDVCRVSEAGLIGEVIEIRGDQVSIQVYEETAGLGPGAPVVTTGEPLSAELGPGLLESIFDGIQRPLSALRDEFGDRIRPGVTVERLDRERRWGFKPCAKPGDEVIAGDILGTVQETSVIEHRIMVPHGMQGKIVDIQEGEFTVTEPIAELERPDGTRVPITMLQRWPVRRSRPVAEKLAPSEPLITGQRIIDTFFPVAKGGAACVPGPFGSGKTVVQHQLAKWADADIVVYVGCGERGNEMTDVLLEFPRLEDPRSGESLMKRTVLIANTSDMPVAAREASVYTGITIAEYYRDMGYSVALMADSTSRWAEALREMSGRLEEMPGEEGYPAYLGSRLADFYERAGKVRVVGDRIGALTVVGAVSPPGGDLSEPVTQNTLRVVKVFWGLDDKLAARRHFPAINWLNSYSLYLDRIDGYLRERYGSEPIAMRQESMALLQQEASLEEIVRLVGTDALSPEDRLVLEAAKSIREDFLYQNAFHEADTYTSLDKQIKMLQVILSWYHEAREALNEGVRLERLLNLPVREDIARAKYLDENDEAAFATLLTDIKQQVAALKGEGGEVA